MDFIDLKTQYQRLKAPIDARIARVLEHGQYILGPEVAELETALAGYVGSRYCVGVSDGTTGLQIAMMALGISAGDEVITTPFTFIATGETIALLGAKPVFVDIHPRTFNIDPSLIEGAITSRTRAIMPVSLYGQCADMTAINAVAARHGLPVIEDAAQSFGAVHAGRRSCGLSTIGSTSFFPSKPLGAYGDGGALFTDDEALATTIRQIRTHGQDRRYHHARLGLNGRLDTLQAAVLLAKFEAFPDEVERRRELGARYSALLHERLGDRVVTPILEAGNTSVFAQYTIRVTDRAAVVAALTQAGVPTAVHYPIALHRQPALAGNGYRDEDFPHSNRAAEEVLSLPMHPYLDESSIARVVDAVAGALA